MRKLFYSLCFIILTINYLQAQQEVIVDLNSGSGRYSIPVWSVQDRDVSVNISVSYNASGIKLGQKSSGVGIGWNLNAGYQISRHLQGFPDDQSNVDVKGWLDGATATTLNSFSYTSDMSTSTCTDELTDYNTLDGIRDDDTEPDLFSYSIPGASGKFLFDKDGNLHLLPFQNVKIEPTFSGDELASFKVIGANGIEYFFEETETSEIVSDVDDFALNPFMLRRWWLISNRAKFTTSWKISKIKSFSGGEINFSYRSETTTKDRRVSVHHDNDDFLPGTFSLEYEEELVNKKLAGITGLTGSSVTFNETTFSQIDEKHVTSIEIFDSRRENPYVKEYVLDYKKLRSPQYAGEYDYRMFLKSIQEVSSCFSIPPHEFEYYDIDLSSTVTTMPSSISWKFDAWGYQNEWLDLNPTILTPAIYVYPSLPLEERIRFQQIPSYSGTEYALTGISLAPDIVVSKRGSLKEITYPAGGLASIEYESHDYYDSVASTTFNAGGLRVKKVSYKDNGNTLRSSEYSYKNTSNLSSGKLMYRPQFLIPSQYDGLSAYQSSNGTGLSAWEKFSARTSFSLSPVLQEIYRGSPVGYEQVKVTNSGQGYSIFNFSMPGEHGASSGPVSVSKIIRGSSCTTAALFANGEYAWPYGLGDIIDYKRGLVQSRKDYNQSDQLVKEVNWAHVEKVISSGTTIKAMAMERHGNSLYTNLYELNTDKTEIVSSEQTTIPEVGTSNEIVNLSTYLYNGSNHTFPTTISITNSENEVFKTEVKYPLDYTIPSGILSDEIETLEELQLSNRIAQPLEQISYKNNEAISARYTEYESVNSSPHFNKTFLLEASAPLTNFTPSVIQQNGSVYEMGKDSRYIATSSVVTYDSHHLPLTSVGMDRMYASTHWGYDKTLPILEAVNCKANEVVFSDFETTSGFEFTISGGSTAEGRTGESGVSPGTTLSKQLSKTAGNYIIRLFHKNQSAVNYQLKLKVGSSTVHTQNLTLPATSEFQFFERSVSLGSVSNGQSYTVEVTATSGASGGDAIDDIAFYPNKATISHRTYDIPHGVSSVTDGRGYSQYISYDRFGRTKYVRDNKKNILEKYSYNYQSDVVPAFTSDFTFTNPAYINEPVSFTANEICLDGVTYEWDFGSGYGEGDITAQHTFTSLGNKTVRLRISRPGETTQVYTKTVNVEQRTLIVSICAKGVETYDKCSNTVVSNYSCSSITQSTTGLETIFMVNSIQNGNGNYTYAWKKSSLLLGLNVSVGTNSDTYSDTSLSPLSVDGYSVKCVVTDSNGVIGESDPITVYVINNPLCSLW